MENSCDDSILSKDNEWKMSENDFFNEKDECIYNENGKDVPKRKNATKKGKRKPVVNLKTLNKRKKTVRKGRTIRQKDSYRYGKRISPNKKGRPRRMNSQNGENNRIKNNLQQLNSQLAEKKMSSSERSLIKRMPHVKTFSQSLNPRIDIGRDDFGRLVFAKIKGWRHWPAMIVNPKDAGLATIPQGNACIFWIGDFRVSPVPLKRIKDFVLYFREDLIRSSLDENYINSVMIALKECCRKAGETDIDTKNFGALLSWASCVFAKNSQMFEPRPGSSNYPALIALCLSRIKKFESSQSKQGQRAWKKKVEVLAAIRSGKSKTDLENVCISCTRPNATVSSRHPIFEGGVCKICREEEQQNNNCADFDEIKHIFCIICRCPCTEFTCDVQTCKLVYCEHCIELLVDVDAVETAKSSYNWKCFACLPHKSITHRLLKKRNSILDSQTLNQEQTPEKMWGEYVIEKIVGRRVYKKKTEYLIKWQGVSEEYNTWEPKESMFGIQNLLSEYRRHLSSLPSSKRKLDGSFSKDESLSSCVNGNEESAYVLTSFNKRKRICPPKVSGTNITTADDAENDGSPVIKKHHQRENVSKEITNTEIDNTDYGAMIWAKIQGFPWWPAMIVKERLCGFPKVKDDEACVFWLGDNRVSKIPLKDVRNFTTYWKKSMFESPNKSYMRAVEQALRICYERGRDSDVDLYTYEDYVNWAVYAFKKDPLRYSPISDLDPYPPKISSLLKMIMNYREAQKEEKWEEEKWELYDPSELKNSSISSVFGRGDWSASKSFTSYEPNSIEDHFMGTTDHSENSFPFKHLKSKKSSVSTSASLDSVDLMSETLKVKKGPNVIPMKEANRGAKKMLLNENSWEVEQIVKHRRTKDVIEYLIKWRGYPSSQNTWEPRSNLIGCSAMLKAYINSSEKLKRSLKNSKILSKQERQALLKIKNKQTKKIKGKICTEHKTKQVATKSAEVSPMKIGLNRCGACLKCDQQEDCDFCMSVNINTFAQARNKQQCNNEATDLIESKTILDLKTPELRENEDVKEIMQGAIKKEDIKGFETPPRLISKDSSNFQPVKKEKEFPNKIQRIEIEVSNSHSSQAFKQPAKSSIRSPLKALIMSAINNSAQGKLKIQEIKDWIEEKDPSFGADDKNRKRIRDLLSHNKTFVKCGEDPPAYWKIANDEIEATNVSSENVHHETFAIPEKVENNDSDDDILELNLSPSIKSYKSDDVIEVCESSSSISEVDIDDDEDEDEVEDDEHDEGIGRDVEFPNYEFEQPKFMPSQPSVDILKSKNEIYLYDSNQSKYMPYKLVPVEGVQPITPTSPYLGMCTQKKFSGITQASLEGVQQERDVAPPPLIDLTEPTDSTQIIDLTHSPVSSSSKHKTPLHAMYGEGTSKCSDLQITPLRQKTLNMVPSPVPLSMTNLVSSKKKSLWYKPFQLNTNYNKEDVTVTVFKPLSTSPDISLPSTSSEKGKNLPNNSQT